MPFQSFFDQPIYRPRSTGKFELRQILSEGVLTSESDGDDDLTELFRKKDLVGKRFYLSTFPLPKRRKKFDRWDQKTLSFVTEEYEPTAAEKKEEDLQPGKNMQVGSRRGALVCCRARGEFYADIPMRLFLRHFLFP